MFSQFIHYYIQRNIFRHHVHLSEWLTENLEFDSNSMLRARIKIVFFLFLDHDQVAFLWAYYQVVTPCQAKVKA